MTKYLSVLILFSLVAVSRAAEPAWVPLTTDLLLREKTGFGGLCGVVVDHSSGDVWVNLSDRGMFHSADQGKTWKQVSDKQPKGRTETPGCWLLDPTGKSKRMVTAFVYGAPISVSSDQAATWKSLHNASAHIDWCAVDWTDPKLRFVLALKHEADGLLLASRDGGQSFEEVGKGYAYAMIANSNFHSRNALMNASTYRFFLSIALLLTLIPITAATAEDTKWISLFDGKTMEGWEKVGNDKSVWEVKDGEINGSGPASMLVSTQGPYKNFRYRAEIKINDGGNSGLYFRTTAKPSFSDGYEAQIDSTHRDPIRTGSLYGFCHVYKQLVKPDTWFTYELEVRDDVWRGRKMTRIKVTVDGNELYEYMDFALTFKEGHFAFQQHDPGSKVSIRKIEVMPIE